MAVEDRAKVYAELCASYRGIDDFRSKLLGFLPLVSGSGAFLLLNDSLVDPKKSEFAHQFLHPIGLFGAVVTLALFSFELYGILRCHSLIEAGRRMEDDMGQNDGQFTTRPRAILYLINEPFASGAIYSAVLAAWVFLVCLYPKPETSTPQTSAALAIATRTFVFSFGLALIYNFVLAFMASKAFGRFRSSFQSALDQLRNQ